MCVCKFVITLKWSRKVHLKALLFVRNLKNRLYRSSHTPLINLWRWRHEDPRWKWIQGSAYKALASGWVVSLTLGRLYSLGKPPPRYSMYRTLSGPQDHSRHEVVKKNLHPSDTLDQTRAVQPVAKSILGDLSGPPYCDMRRLNQSFPRSIIS